MERGSAKHGPRLDEQQKHETEGMVRGGGSTHAEEWKEPEPMPSPGEAAPSYAPGHAPGVPQGMTPRDVELRSDLAKWISDTHWPASKSELLERARTEGAPDHVLDLVESLPDRDYRNMADIAKALGLGVEQRRF